MTTWNKTSDGYPTHEKPVLVSNGKWIYAALAIYVVADESEGWIWEGQDAWDRELNNVGSYCLDDEYEFEYWIDLPDLPETDDA